MTGISTRTIFTEWANTCGLMAECTRATGLTTEWRVEVSSLGVMEENMLANIEMIKSTEMVRLLGPMGAVIRVNGTRVSNTAKASILKKVRNVMASGKWAKE